MPSGHTGRTRNSGQAPLNELSAAAVAAAAGHYNFFGGSGAQFQQALQVLQDFCKKTPAKCRGNFALTIAQVEVKGKGMGAMDPVRVVGFVSKGGLPKDLLDQYTRLGVQIYQAAATDGQGKGKGHSEARAERYRTEVGRQIKDLGGKITNVISAYVNVRVCSEECARALTKFIGRDDIQIPVKSNGFINGRIINTPLLKQLRNLTGRGPALDVVLRSLKSGFFGMGRGRGR